MTNKKAFSLIAGLRKEKIKTIDLSYNPLLNTEFYRYFSSSYLSDERTQLAKLILEGN